jgi:hypothetical protein
MALLRTWAVAAAGTLVGALSARAQDVRQQEAYRATLNGVYVRITAATSPGLEISAGKPPDHVLLSPVLPEAALAWADSALRLLDAPDTAAAGHQTVTMSSGMLVDSTHDAASLDRVLGDVPSHCSLFFADAANLNHVRTDVPCATARLFLEGLRRAATTQVGYDRTDSTSPAATAAKESRSVTRRQDSLVTAAQSGLKRYRDSAAGAIP